MHTCNVIWIEKVIFKNLGYIIYDMMYMYIATKNEGYDLRERKRVMCMGRIGRRKRKGTMV